MDPKTLEICKLQEEPFILCLFCWNKCSKVSSLSHLQHSAYICKECPSVVAYYVFWGEKKPFKYMIFNVKEENTPWYKLEVAEKTWCLRSGSRMEMVAWSFGELIASGSFDEDLPPINPSNFLSKLPTLLTFS